MRQNIEKFQRGELIAYKSMDGGMSIYKVVDINHAGSEIKYFLVEVQYDRPGEMRENRTKKFETTLKNKKTGEVRLFNIWFAMGDILEATNSFLAQKGTTWKVIGFQVISITKDAPAEIFAICSSMQMSHEIKFSIFGEHSNGFEVLTPERWDEPVQPYIKTRGKSRY